MIAGLILIGLMLIATALKNTQHELGQQFQTDLLGQDGFIAWAGAIMAIGAIGYIPGLRTASRYLLVLLGVVMVIRNGGVFANAEAALQGASAAGPAPSVVSPLIGSTAGTGSTAGGFGGSSSSGGSSAGSAIGTIATDTATGAAIGGPYGAAAGAAIGIISSVF
jgi:hypothetical protein